MDFYKFWQILEGTNESSWNMEPENRADFEHHYGSPEDDAPDTSVHGDEEVELKLTYSNGVFKDQNTGKVVNIPVERSIIGEPNDTYSLRARIIVSGNVYQNRRNGEWEIDNDNVNFEVDGCELHNDRTDQGFEVPDPEVLFHLSGFQNKNNAPYEILWDHSWGGRNDTGSISISVR